MSRSGFIFGMSGPAAILALLAQPVVQKAADRMSPQAAVTVTAPTMVRALEPIAFRVASARQADRPAETSTIHIGSDRATMKQPRRLVRDGCELAISSLAGPEARRMVPGRCIA